MQIEEVKVQKEIRSFITLALLPIILSFPVAMLLPLWNLTLPDALSALFWMVSGIGWGGWLALSGLLNKYRDKQPAGQSSSWTEIAESQACPKCDGTVFTRGFYMPKEASYLRKLLFRLLPTWPIGYTAKECKSCKAVLVKGLVQSFS